MRFLAIFTQNTSQFQEDSKIISQCLNQTCISHCIQQLLVMMERSLKYRFVQKKWTALLKTVLRHTGDIKKGQIIIQRLNRSRLKKNLAGLKTLHYIQKKKVLLNLQVNTWQHYSTMYLKQMSM